MHSPPTGESSAEEVIDSPATVALKVIGLGHQYKEIAVTTDITNNLPQVVADHIAACNAHDAEAWMATFAPDAMLNDIQREFIGTAAIRGFGEKEIFGVKVTMEVQRAWDRHGDVTVHAKLDGTYDKTGLPDPLILSFYFSLRGDQITQLIIIHNKTEV